MAPHKHRKFRSIEGVTRIKHRTRAAHPRSTQPLQKIVYQEAFAKRLQDLGFDSYEAYLRSPHWEQFKQSYRESGNPLRCASCFDPKYELHHKTYIHLGAESFRDVIPLCRKCHSLVHEVTKFGVSLQEATSMVVSP